MTSAKKEKDSSGPAVNTQNLGSDLPPAYSPIDPNEEPAAPLIAAVVTPRPPVVGELKVDHKRPTELVATKSLGLDRPLFFHTTNVSKSSLIVEHDVDPSNTDHVVVRVEVGAQTSDLADRCTFTMEANDRGEYEIHASLKWSLWNVFMTSCKFVVRVPATMDIAHPGIRAELSGDHVVMGRLTNVDFAWIDIQTSNADVTLTAVNGGRVRIRTSNCTIEANNVAAKECLELETTDSAVTLKNSDSADIRVQTTNAKIQLQNVKGGNVVGNTSNAKIGCVNVVCNNLVLRTSNGGLETDAATSANSMRLTTRNTGIKGVWNVKDLLDVSTSNSKIEGCVVLKDPSAKTSISLHTSNAKIRVNLPADAFRAGAAFRGEAPVADAGNSERAGARAPVPSIEQTGGRSDAVTVSYDLARPLSITTKGIRTSNVRIEKAARAQAEMRIQVRVDVSSLSTTLHGRLHARSSISDSGEYVLVVDVDSSLWDLGMTSAEIVVVVPVSGESPADHLEVPGISVSVPSGAIGATMLGNTSVRCLELHTSHGPAHLSDLAVGSLKLTAHNGNITMHDVCAGGKVEVVGMAAWMDIDDVKAAELVATSSDAIISLKDIEARQVSAATSNARIGLGNVKAGTLTVDTTRGNVVASNVHAVACQATATKGDIEGDWTPSKTLYLSTGMGKITSQVQIGGDEQLEVTLRAKNGPIAVDLPASFSGGFSLKTTGYYKTFIYTSSKVKASPVLHVAKPDEKAGALSSGGKMLHSLTAISEEAPVTANFGNI
ncbi:hypothetical protein GGF46_000968 [Coemansia sp. RSA 552]|nr:hypothetical protein GGF46_000968 [Coemansia sp. RSA 552]